MAIYFHYFQRLPAEIRGNIWMEALIEERVIIFDLEPSTQMWLRLTPEPALLYVNQESKEYATKYYKQFLCRTTRDSASKTQTTHLNPGKDICYFLTPKGLPVNETTYHSTPYCAGIRPRRYAFDGKLLISYGASVYCRNQMLLWMRCVLRRMSWCRTELGDAQVDEFCIMVTDDDIAQTIRYSEGLHHMKISQAFTQELKPRLEAAKSEFQAEILKVCNNMEWYLNFGGYSQPPHVSFGNIELV